MSYKKNMHPSVSKAEIQVFQELSKRGLTKGMVTQQPVVLKLTIPDFMWNEKRKVVYLDGQQVHQQKQEYDEEIKNLLEIRGWSVLRITYNPPLTEAELEKVTNQIQDFVGEM